MTKRYRLLNNGEKIQFGDEFWCCSGWTKTGSVGAQVGLEDFADMLYRREIAPDYVNNSNEVQYMVLNHGDIIKNGDEYTRLNQIDWTSTICVSGSFIDDPNHWIYRRKIEPVNVEDKLEEQAKQLVQELINPCDTHVLADIENYIKASNTPFKLVMEMLVQLRDMVQRNNNLESKIKENLRIIFPNIV